MYVEIDHEIAALPVALSASAHVLSNWSRSDAHMVHV